jgi:hypothetical protein
MHGRRCRVLAVALIALAAAVPADAAPSTQVARSILLDGPQLAGGQVLWMTGSAHGGYALWSASPGARPRLWFESDSGVSHPSAGVTVPYHHSRLLVGENLTHLAQVAECSGVGDSFPYAVGTAFVALMDACRASDLDDTGSRRLRYVDFSADQPLRRTVNLAGGRFMAGEFNDSMRVSGRWAAVDGPATAVIDLAGGREAYRVERVGGWALGADGTLVTVSQTEDRCQAELAFHTVAEPSPHPLPYLACNTAVDVDSGRILFTGEAAGRTTLMLGGLDGAPPRPIVHDDGLVWRSDLEGTQIAYQLDTCGPATAIRLISVEESDLRPPADRRCPVRLITRRASIGPRWRVTLRVRCPRGCAIAADLRVPRRTRAGHTFRPRLASAGAESSGPAATLRFEVPAGARARLPGGTVAARVDLFSPQLGDSGETVLRVPIRLRLR